MKRIKIFLSLALIIATFVQCKKTEQLAQTPPMGWNSWNYFGKRNINQDVAKECMDAMVDNGLLDAGYNYFVIDGGWRDTLLNEDGTLKVHPVKFANGIKPLVDYAHAKGLKFGLHTVPGSHDCGGDKVGAYGIEEIHIQQFIDWGVDFLKVDRCRLELDCDEPCWSEEKIEEVYRRWRKILDKKKSNIVLSVSAYQFRDWNPEVCNLSRTTGDISCKITKGAFFTEEERSGHGKHFFSVYGIAKENNKSANYARAGYWNDPDMLVTGDHGLNLEEQYTHFALWCVMSSPLILGNDPRHITKEEASIILNKKAIAINQDPTEQGQKLLSKDGIDFWKKNLKNGSCALVALNTTLNDTLSFQVDLNELGITKATAITDVYTNKVISKVNNLNYTLTPHACKFLLIE